MLRRIHFPQNGDSVGVGDEESANATAREKAHSAIALPDVLFKRQW
jgi:hypothetical protein